MLLTTADKVDLRVTLISFISYAGIINHASGSNYRDDWQGVIGLNFQVSRADIGINALGFGAMLGRC
jgi:hypothetical protein